MKQAFMLLAAVLVTTAHGQCGMTTYVGIIQGCHFAPQANVSTNGGTPPYTIQVEKRNAITLAWSNVFTVSNDADGFVEMPGSLHDWDDTDRARATVTDAVNCVATWTESFGTYVHFSPVPSVSIDCVAGTSSISINTQLCPNGNLFSLDGGPLQNFLSYWSSTSPGTYRYNGVLSPGTHSLVMSDTFCSSAPASPTYCYEPTSISFALPAISAGDCGVNFRVRAGLDGALPTGTIMNDALRTAGLLPATEPYSALGYAYVGQAPGATVSPSLFGITGNDAIVDWVVLELRSASTPTTVVHSKAALLQRDGDVMDTDGDEYINMPVSPGSYYLAIRHRNHLGVMTSNSRALTLNPTSAMVDFYGANSGFWGTAPRVQRGTVWCMWTGDANSDGTVKYTGPNNDRDPILVAIGGSTPTNVVSGVYSTLDVNMDGQIKYIGANNDRDPILTTVGGSTPNAVRVQQLP
ncbi:MAG: hypothetical protein IPM12_05760 [Flavobacteriales bacterium]|nr:hypothetical protein [Flavobacteriales bacterium]